MVNERQEIIRQWFTAEQACEYLSKKINCEFVIEDLQAFFMDDALDLFFKTVTEEQIRYKTPIDIKISGAWFTEVLHSSGSTIGESEAILVDFVLPKGEYKVHTHGVKMLDIIKGDIGMIPVNAECEPKIAILTEYCHENTVFIEGDTFGGILDTKNYHPITYERLQDLFLENQGKVHIIFIEAWHGIIGYPRHELDRFIKNQINLPSEAVVQKRPTPISDQHKNNLLQQIKANGFEQQSLPEGKGGKAGAKSILRESLVPHTMTQSQFEKTWERAMKDKVIQYKK